MKQRMSENETLVKAVEDIKETHTAQAAVKVGEVVSDAASVTKETVGKSKDKVSEVISPIGERGSEIRAQADKVLRHIVRAALDPDFVVHRADDDSNPGAITPQIISNILAADLIVADISGGNANVFYELAIAHGYDKPTVHIQSTEQRVPFDIKDMRVIPYDTQDLDTVEEAKKALRESAAFAAADPAKIDTPLKGAESFKAVKESGDPAAHVQAQILDDLAELKAMVLRTTPSPRDPRTTSRVVDMLGYQKI